MLFINADRDYREGRAQNYLAPEHIEKIVRAFEAFEDVPGFARVVTRAELRENDDNLNIRRYADNAPPPEPQDVRAHLHGGIPRFEVDAKNGLFGAHGLDPSGLLKDGPDGYFVFADAVDTRPRLADLVAQDLGVVAKERALRGAVHAWWAECQDAVANLGATRRLMELRTDLLASFDNAVRPDRLRSIGFEAAGVIATWWGESQTDLRTIAARGCAGLVSAWQSQRSQRAGGP